MLGSFPPELMHFMPTVTHILSLRIVSSISLNFKFYQRVNYTSLQSTVYSLHNFIKYLAGPAPRCKARWSIGASPSTKVDSRHWASLAGDKQILSCTTERLNLQMSYYLSHGIASTVLGIPFCWLADKHKFWVVDKSLIIQMWSFHDDRWCISLEVWDLYPSFFIIPPSKTCEKMYTYIQRLQEVKNCDGKKRWQWQCKHPTNSRMSRSCSLKTRFLQHSNSSTSRNHTCQHCHRPVKRTVWGKCSAWRWLSLQPSQMFPAQPQIEKNISDKPQHTNQCDAESNAYFCNLWSQNQPKKACGKLRTLEDSCGQQLENSDVIHLHPSPMLQGELLLFCFVASLWLFDSDVALQYSQEAQRKKKLAGWFWILSAIPPCQWWSGVEDVLNKLKDTKQSMAPQGAVCSTEAPASGTILAMTWTRKDPSKISPRPLTQPNAYHLSSYEYLYSIVYVCISHSSFLAAVKCTRCDFKNLR